MLTFYDVVVADEDVLNPDIEVNRRVIASFLNLDDALTYAEFYQHEYHYIYVQESYMTYVSK